MHARRVPRFPAAGILAILALLPLPGHAAPDRKWVEDAAGAYVWDGISAGLRAAPPGLPSGPGHRFVPYDHGRRLLVLGTAEEPAGRGRKKREGEARLYDVSGPAPAAIGRIDFEGEPVDATVARDAARAWVVTLRREGKDDAATMAWVHALDLIHPQVSGTAFLRAPASALALDPTGRRLLLSQRNRIQTYSVEPLASSWYYRSRGSNGPLVVEPASGVIGVVRGMEVALIDPAVAGRLTREERRARSDDTTTRIPLPFVAARIALSEDSRLLAVSGPGALVFVDLADGALSWPGTPIPHLQTSADPQAVSFPGAGRDLILALGPAAGVVPVRAPDRARPGVVLRGPGPHGGPSAAASASEEAVLQAPAESASPAVEEPGPPAVVEAAPPAGAEAAPPVAARPPGAGPVPPPPPPPVPGAAPAPERPEPRPALSGRVTGDRTQARAVVLFGPDSILKEYGRAALGPDGTWSLPLPPAGRYRIMPIGDGSTPLAASPNFLSITVAPDAALGGLDFEIKPSGRTPGPPPSR